MIKNIDVLNSIVPFLTCEDQLKFRELNDNIFIKNLLLSKKVDKYFLREKCCRLLERISIFEYHYKIDLSALKQLTYVRVVESPMPIFSEYNNIIHLSLSSITAGIDINALKKLKELHIWNCPKFCEASFYNCTNISDLVILNNENIRDLNRFTNLCYLNASGSENISDASITQCVNLEILKHVNPSGYVPDIRPFKRLKELVLSPFWFDSTVTKVINGVKITYNPNRHIL